MTTSPALFPGLLGDAWPRLASPVRDMHGDASRVFARGAADVEGATNLLARCSRRLLGLPEPGPAQPLEVTIERHGTREIWTRRFAGGSMRSVLDRVEHCALLSERLGPTTLRFRLHADQGSIDWRLQSVRVLGVPLPRRLAGDVLSRSGESDGRYSFLVDVRMPLLGRLIAYRGWLEIVERD
jgi:hypothetical protein